MASLLLTQQEHHIFERIITDFHLTAQQAEHIKQYISMLLHANEQFNITTITDITTVLTHHIQDSLMVSKFLDYATFKGIADVGTGGGFPGIPLKILYPQLPVYLIEVSEKKCAFLQSVIEKLSLPECYVISLDWRTFLRKTSYPIDLFVSRASLHPDELIRIFSPSTHYAASTLIYWASEQWEPLPKEKPFIHAEYEYAIEHKKRRLIAFTR